ncbi:MAG: Gfo/Idh/MocA family protein [Clostridiaceae bacterium]
MGTIKVMDTPKVVLDTRDTDKVRIGVIGCGYWGPNLIRNFRDNPNSSVVAVADLRPEKLEYIRSNFPDVEAISDYRQLFTMGLDAVVVATPPG